MNSDIILGSSRIQWGTSKMRSAHRHAGQRNQWCPAGINGDYYDLWERIDADQLAGWTNTRGALYYDTGLTNYRVEATWAGNHGFTCFPMVCVNPDASEFSYTAYLEPDLGSAIILWELGRNAIPTSDIVAVGSESFLGAPHVDGTPVDVRMDVIDNVLTVYFDGDLYFTQPVTANLQGSGIVGVSMDKLQAVSGDNDIHEGMLTSSFRVTPL